MFDPWSLFAARGMLTLPFELSVTSRIPAINSQRKYLNIEGADNAMLVNAAMASAESDDAYNRFFGNTPIDDVFCVGKY